MGVVYQARQLGLARTVALKILRPALQEDERDRQRFRHEAQAMAQLNHPGIVHVHEVGDHAGLPYFSMEYVEGGSLAERLRQGPLAFRAAATLVEQLARAVFAAHEQGVIHRDLKPSNILLTAKAELEPSAHGTTRSSQPTLLLGSDKQAEHSLAKVSDFGLARRLRDDPRMTQAGAIVGTPSYMAPEQASGEGGDGDSRSVGKHADVYSLGAVLYECLTGRPPFMGATTLDTLSQVLHQDPVPPSRLRPGCPRDLENICLRCLHKAPKRRYVSALSLANDLSRFLTAEPVLARPIGPLERTVKWARRRPALAALLCLVALSVTGLIAGVGYLAHLSEANRQREHELFLDVEQAWKSEQRQRAEVEKAQQRETELRLLGEQALYYNRIALAQRELSAFNVARASELLDACPVKFRHWEWSHLKRRGQGSQTVLPLGSEPLTALAFSPDGKLLALGIGDLRKPESLGYVELRDENTLEVVRKLPDLHGGAASMTFSPDGQYLAAVGVTFDLIHLMVARGKLQDGTSAVTSVWDLGGNKTEQWPNITAVAWSQDNKLIATGSLDCRVTVRKWPGKGMQFRSEPLPGVIAALRISADGRWLIAGWQQIKVRAAAEGTGAVAKPSTGEDVFQFGASVWDLASNKLVMEFPDVSALALRPDGKELALGTLDGLIELREVGTWQLRDQLRGHSRPISALAYRGGNFEGPPLLASGSLDRSIRIWDLDSKSTSQVLVGTKQIPGCVVFNLLRAQVLSAAGETNLRSWDLSAGTGTLELPGPAQPNGRPVFSPDAKLLFVSAAETVRGYDLATGQPLLVPSDLQKCVVVADKSQTLSAASAVDVQLYDVRQFSTQAQTKPSQRIAVGDALALAITPAGDRLFISSFGSAPALTQTGGLSAWQVPGGEPVWKLENIWPAVALALSPDQSLLGVLEITGSVRILDARNGKEVRVLHQPLGVAWIASDLACIAFSPDGRYLVCSPHTEIGETNQHDVILWETATGLEHGRLRGFDGNITGLAYTPDGKRLAVSSIDLNRGTGGEVRLFDMTNNTEVLTLPGQRGVAFSPDGRLLAAVGFEHLTRAVVRVWEALPPGP
jgi:WD40 repeat protein